MVRSGEPDGAACAVPEPEEDDVGVSQEQVDALYDAEVMSVDGDRLGPVRQVYVDDRTGVPTWVTVRTGWFGGREHPVPLDGAERTEHGIRVSASGPEIREAPTVEEDEHLGAAQLDELYRYYGLAPSVATEQDAPVVADPPPQLRRHDRPGRE